MIQEIGKWKQIPINPPGLSKVHWVRWTPSALESADGSDCQAVFHHQCYLSTGQVPEEWSLASVPPIDKQGCKEDPENYRLKLGAGKGYGADNLE